MGKLQNNLTDLLPGALPKTLLTLPIALAGILYVFFPDLPAKYLPNTEEEQFLWRLIIPGSIILIGAWSLVASLVYEIHKIKDDKSKTQEAARSLHKSLIIIMQLVTDEKNRIKDRHAILQTKDLTTYTKDTIAEINGLNASGHFIEKISATILRYVDSAEAQSQPVVPPNAVDRMD